MGAPDGSDRPGTDPPRGRARGRAMRGPGERGARASTDPTGAGGSDGPTALDAEDRAGTEALGTGDRVSVNALGGGAGTEALDVGEASLERAATAPPAIMLTKVSAIAAKTWLTPYIDTSHSCTVPLLVQLSRTYEWVSASIHLTGTS